MTYAVVQRKSVNQVSSSATITVTPDSGLTTGNLVRLAMTYSADFERALSTVQDQATNNLTYTAQSLFDGTNGFGVHHIIIQNMPASVTAITVTLAAAADYQRTINLCEYSGLRTSGAVGATLTPVGAACSNTTDANSTGNLTPSDQPGIVDAYINLGAATSIPNAGTGFSSDVDDTWADGCRAERLRITSTSAVPATFTGTGAGGERIQMSAVVLLESVAAARNPMVGKLGFPLIGKL